MVLPEDKTPGDLALDHPILSAELKVKVTSTYTRKENGFASIRIWTKGEPWKTLNRWMFGMSLGLCKVIDHTMTNCSIFHRTSRIRNDNWFRFAAPGNPDNNRLVSCNSSRPVSEDFRCENLLQPGKITKGFAINTTVRSSSAQISNRKWSLWCLFSTENQSCR